MTTAKKNIKGFVIFEIDTCYCTFVAVVFFPPIPVVNCDKLLMGLYPKIRTR